MSDSLAVLQTTLIIAVFTIFVFGGLITEVRGRVTPPPPTPTPTPTPTLPLPPPLPLPLPLP